MDNANRLDKTDDPDISDDYKKANREKLELYMQALSSVCFNNVAWYYSAINGVIPRKDQQEIMEDWNVKDAESLKQQVDWLLDEGRRAEFNKMRNYLSTISEVERKKFIASLPESNKSTIQMQVVHDFLRRLPDTGIAAVDYAWCAYLCQAGNRFGYLNDEYTKYMLRLAEQAQRSYTGWDTYIIAFTVGVQFVDKKTSKDYVPLSMALFNKLLYSPYSPMRRIDWNTKFLETS